MALNTATSIVDFLKGQNKPSDFSSRKGLYDTSGLGSAFGDYRGTPEQNVALLNRVKTATPAPLPAPSPAPIKSPGPTAAGIIDETTPSAPFDPTKAIKDLTEEAQKEAGEEVKGLTFDLAGTTARGEETIRRNVESLTRVAGEGTSALAVKGTQAQELIGEKAAGFGGAFSGATKKSQAEVAQEVATKQASIQAKLGDQLYNTFTDFEKQFGTKFLESLSIPEAEQFVKLPAPVRGILMQNYQEAVQKAEAKAQKGVVDALDKLGYIVIGGQILQKPGEARAEAREERAISAEERTARRLELSEAASIRAEEAAQRAEARFQLEKTQGTQAERTARVYDEIRTSAFKDLEASKGADGYINADTYESYKKQITKSAPTKIEDFDKEFGLSLNPADALRIGVNQAQLREKNKLEALLNSL